MSPQLRRMAHARGVSGLALAALLGAAVLGFSHPTPALTDVACSGERVNNVKISAGRSDFGGDPHLVGAPSTAGRLCWGNGGAIIEGQLYYDDPARGGCAHISVEFFNSNRTAPVRMSLFNQKVCRTGPGLLKQASIFSQVNRTSATASGRVGRVTIALSTSETANGTRTSTNFTVFTH